MRKLINTFYFLSISIFTHAQQKPMQPVQSEQVAPRTFEDYLVQLAWNYSPEAQGVQYEIEARGQEIQLAKKDWTRNLQAGLNLNDVSLPYFLHNNLKVPGIDTQRFTRIATYPLWQVGIGINFGDVIQRKHKIKYAENRRKITETELTLKKQQIKAMVLKRYQDYLVALEILKVRLQSLDVAKANKSQISDLFSVNKVNFEDFNNANKAYFDAEEGRLKAQSEIKIQQIGLEELIGVKWEVAEKTRAVYNSKK